MFLSVYNAKNVACFDEKKCIFAVKLGVEVSICPKDV